MGEGVDSEEGERLLGFFEFDVAEEEGGGSRHVVVGDERGRYERILGVEILEMEFGFGVELFSVEEDEEIVRAGGVGVG